MDDDCVYNKDECDCCKCFICNKCTNGSQMHRSCGAKKTLSLVAGPEESLPTEEQEKEAEVEQKVAQALLQEKDAWEEGELDYYKQQEIFYTNVFEKVNIKINDLDYYYWIKMRPYSRNGIVSVYRYLNEIVTRDMFIVMKGIWKDIACWCYDDLFSFVQFVHFEWNSIYHIGCVDPRADRVELGYIAFCNMEEADFNFVLNDREHYEYLFCTKCNLCIFSNGLNNMPKEKVEEIIDEFEDKNTTTTLCAYDFDDESYFVIREGPVVEGSNKRLRV